MSVPIYKQIQKDIFQMIASAQLREGDRIASESEIMKKYFVSSITARNALNALVDQGVAHRIKGKGTFVSASPFSIPPLQKRNTGITIGAVLPGTTNYMHYLDEYCQQKGFGLYIRYARESQEAEIEILRKFTHDGVTGILLFPAVSEVSNTAVNQLVSVKFPFIFLDRYLPDVECSSVVCDNLQGARLASDYLLNAVGKNVAVLHFPLCNNAVIDRVEGFRASFAAAGETPDESNFCAIDDLLLLDKGAEQRIEHILKVIVEHMRAYSHIRGFFATNVEIAQVAYYAVRFLGFSPGGDFSIVSFDNPYLSGVHFIQQDYRRMVENAINHLARQFEGDFTVMRDLIPTRFVHVEMQPDSSSGLQHLVNGFHPNNEVQ